jgi:hypothetical protein
VVINFSVFLFAKLLELWQDIMGLALIVNNAEKLWFKVVVLRDVDLDSTKNHDLAVIGTSFDYLEDIVTNVLVQQNGYLCVWLLRITDTFSVLPNDVLYVLHLDVMPHHIDSRGFL